MPSRLSLGLFLALLAPAFAQDEAPPAPPAEEQEVVEPAAPVPFTGQGGAARISAVTRNEKTAAATFQIAKNGQITPIFVAETASDVTKAAAQDLAKYLGQMAGAKFEVQVGDGSKGIVLGTKNEFSHPELAKELEIYDGFNGREAFAIRATATRLLILGASDSGAQNGVYRVLDELGCRWLAPASWWEAIPVAPDLKWNKDITDRPALLSRAIWYKSGFDIGKEGHPTGGSSTGDWNAWRRRNNHGESLKIMAGHNYSVIIRANQEAFNAHPEYWPLIGGERLNKRGSVGPQPDLGNKEVRKLFVDYALNFFKNNPNADMVSMEPNDSGSYSQSEEFKALGTISDAVFGMANEIAREVAKQYPGKMVGLYAYREHSDPPSFQMEPNVYVQITSALFSKLSKEEIAAAWTKKARYVGFYDYYAPYAWHLDRPPGGQVAAINAIAGRLREQVAVGSTSISGEASGSWANSGVYYWILNKIMWNPSLDVETLRDDYFRSGFGPVAAQVKRYYALFSPETRPRPLVTDNLIYEAALELQKADAILGIATDQELQYGADAAQNEKLKIAARLDDLKSYLRYLELSQKTSLVARDAPVEEREAAFNEFFKHQYKTRFSYITHWGLAPQFLFRPVASRLGIWDAKTGKMPNPDLGPSTKWPKNPWRDPTFYTRAEIAANFKSTLDFFKSDLVEYKAFSSNLVAVKWKTDQLAPPLPPKPAPRNKEGEETESAGNFYQWQGGGNRFAYLSKAGEPLKFVFGASAANGDHKSRPWTVRDGAEKIIAQGEISPDDPIEKKTLEVPVPKAGVYLLDARDSGGFVRLTFPVGAPVAFVLQSARQLGTMRYFYVPKGTQKIQFNLDPGTKFVFTAPSGQKVEGLGSRAFQSVEVPGGMDGKVWSLAARGGRLWFANLPPVFAWEAQNVVVPREVAERDGLAF